MQKNRTIIVWTIEPLLFELSPIDGFQNQLFRTSNNNIVLKTPYKCIFYNDMFGG
jgi:hypothetical protein